MRRIQNWAALLLFFICSHAFGQTAVRVTYYNGTVQTFTVSTTGKLYFATDNLLVKPDETTAPTTIPVSIIRKVTFPDSLPTLPVDLVSFKVVVSNCSAIAHWQSGVEGNFSHYELEYGTSGTTFNTAATVASKGSNSSYSATLPSLQGKCYFRLKMVDKDGSTRYSSVVASEVTCLENSSLSVYPNPGMAVIHIRSGSTIGLNVKIFTAVGQLVKQGIYQPNQDIDIAALAPGFYVIQVNGQTIKFSKK